MDPPEKEKELQSLARSIDLGLNLVKARRQLAEDLAWLVLHRLRRLSECSSDEDRDGVK